MQCDRSGPGQGSSQIAQDQRHADIRGELVGSAINAVSFAHSWRIGSRRSSEFAGGLISIKEDPRFPANIVFGRR